MSSDINEKTYEICVILGGGVDSRGNLPLWVYPRLDLAVELFEQKKFHTFLLSGRGKGRPAITEAEAMGRYLLEKGVPESNILEEGLSQDTFENAFFSRVLHIDPMGVKSFLVITSGFHLERTRRIFRWVFSEDYEIDYLEASDADIEKTVLEQRKQLETTLMQLYGESVYSSVPNGDLEGIHAILFRKNDSRYLGYRAALEKLPGVRPLY